MYLNCSSWKEVRFFIQCVERVKDALTYHATCLSFRSGGEAQRASLMLQRYRRELYRYVETLQQECDVREQSRTDPAEMPIYCPFVHLVSLFCDMLYAFAADRAAVVNGIGWSISSAVAETGRREAEDIRQCANFLMERVGVLEPAPWLFVGFDGSTNLVVTIHGNHETPAERPMSLNKRRKRRELS